MPRLLLYCTKAKPQLSKVSREYALIKTKDNQNIFEALNGKIVAECDFEVETQCTDYRCIDFCENDENGKSDLIRSCLTREQLCNYVKGKQLFYAIHIKNLHIFNEPKELSEYRTFITDKDRFNDFANVKNFELVSVRIDEWWIDYE